MVGAGGQPLFGSVIVLVAMLVTVPLFSAHAQTAEATRVERVEKFLEKTSPGRGECGVTSYSVAVACSTILDDGSPEHDAERTLVRFPRETFAGGG